MPEDIVRAGSDVRGTQSFVHVMASTWKRPSLVALEVLWRWIIGAIVLWILYIYGARVWLIATGGTADPASVHMAHFNLTDPLAASERLAYATSQILPPAIHIAQWLVPVLLAAWVIAAGFGRSAVLRRMDPTLHPKPLTLIILGALRAACLTLTIALWFLTLRWAGTVTVTTPNAHGAEPNLVLFFALAITATTLYFIAWSLTSWVLNIAPVLAVRSNLNVAESLRSAFRIGPLRGKLIEINLVMGIVKVALVVLAMVFSATPLPFETYTTDAFLWTWNIGVAILYLIASDFFHVVRTASSVALCQAYETH